MRGPIVLIALFCIALGLVFLREANQVKQFWKDSTLLRLEVIEKRLDRIERWGWGGGDGPLGPLQR